MSKRTSIFLLLIGSAISITCLSLLLFANLAPNNWLISGYLLGLLLLIVVFIFAPSKKTIKPMKPLKALGGGLYENTDPPQNQDFPIFETSTVDSYRHQALHHLSKIFQELGNWHGISEDYIKQFFSYPERSRMVIQELKNMAREGLFERIEILDPKSHNRQIVIYFVRPGFEELFQ